MEAKHKTHAEAHHGAHTGYQVHMMMSGNPSHRVAERNSNQEFLQAVGSNVEVVVLTCFTFMGGALVALFLAYCLWGGEATTTKGLPPLHGRGGFPYMAAFPKQQIHQQTIASMPYDLGNVYTGKTGGYTQKQSMQDWNSGVNMGQNFVSASPQCIPPISTTRY